VTFIGSQKLNYLNNANSALVIDGKALTVKLSPFKFIENVEGSDDKNGVSVNVDVVITSNHSVYKLNGISN